MFRKYYHEANDEINSEELLSRILKKPRKIPAYKKYSAMAAAIFVMAVSVSSFSFIKDRQSEKNGLLPQSTSEAVLANESTSTPIATVIPTVIPTEKTQNNTQKPIVKSKPTEEVYYATDKTEEKQTVKAQVTNPPVTDVPITQPPNTPKPTLQPTQPPITDPPQTSEPEEDSMQEVVQIVEDTSTQRPSSGGGGSGGGGGGASSSSAMIKTEAMIDVMVEIGVSYPKDGETAQVNGVTVYLGYDGDFAVGGFEYSGVSYKITAGSRNDVMKKARSIIQ